MSLNHMYRFRLINRILRLDAARDTVKLRLIDRANNVVSNQELLDLEMDVVSFEQSSEGHLVDKPKVLSK